MRALSYRRLGITEPVTRQGFEMCRLATRRTGEIEYAVARLLPPLLRVAMWALYGAARTIDDLAEGGDSHEATVALDRWSQAFDHDLQRGGSDDPVRAALLHTILTWQLPPSYLQTVFQGQRADASGRDFDTWDDWNQYVDLVNAPFLIQAASLFVQNAGLSVSLRQDAGTFDVWQNLARAINLTDALADIGEDSAHHRVRLPSEALDSFGVRREDLLEGRSPPGLGPLVRHLVETARRWFDNSPALPPILHPALGIAIGTYIDLHKLLLARVDQHAARLPPHRITIGRRDTARMLIPARMRTALAWSLFPSPLGSASSLVPPMAPPPPTGRRSDAGETSQRPVPPRQRAEPPQAGSLRHVAIIMDGNGRWAAAHGRPRTDGHRAGIRALDDVIRGATEIGIPFLTVYAFSTENWKRPADEVNTLMHLIPHDLLLEHGPSWHQRGTRVRWSGQRAGLPLDILSALTTLTELTRHNAGVTLTLCVNYGGRAEITTAAARFATDAAAGRVAPTALTEAHFARYLDRPDLPDVDLLIRTGSEHRTSNFLPWQAAYAEMLFVDKPWPQFTRHDLRQAAETFDQRTRRFGSIERAPVLDLPEEPP